MICRQQGSAHQALWALAGSTLLIMATRMVLGFSDPQGPKAALVIGSELDTFNRPDADVLDYLLSTGEISQRDGLLVTWFRKTNTKAEVVAAVKSHAMILEGDVVVLDPEHSNGHTAPVMGFNPQFSSKNLLRDWLETVLAYPNKAIILDFHNIPAVGPALDILREMTAAGIVWRPVWFKADLVKGPNSPSTLEFNGTAFLSLVQEKYPQATLSPGWSTTDSPEGHGLYTQDMVEEMHQLVGAVPQKVVFFVRACMVRASWPQISWLLDQSERYSMTLWEESYDLVSTDDLLYVRDNTAPDKVYYALSDATLSVFKHWAANTARKQRYYTGGSLVPFLQPHGGDGLDVEWVIPKVRGTGRRATLTIPGTEGMILLQVRLHNTGTTGPEPIVRLTGRPAPFRLEICLQKLAAHPGRWGIHLQIEEPGAIEPTLALLHHLYSMGHLTRPIWLGVTVSHGSFTVPSHVVGTELLRAVTELFPHVTLALGWPEDVLGSGYGEQLLTDMLQLCQGLRQPVSFQLEAESLGPSTAGVVARLLAASPRATVTVQHEPDRSSYAALRAGLLAARGVDRTRVYYRLPERLRKDLLADVGRN